MVTAYYFCDYDGNKMKTPLTMAGKNAAIFMFELVFLLRVLLRIDYTHTSSEQ